ncbi:MAG: alanine--tRNA ligase [Flavobacteriales bacterium]|nr:alanine--tRNA ligase [Flavobacteriales bacterium]
MKSEDIKKNFLDFFKSKGHKVNNSIPLVLKDDPSLMFVNAGMNQFKDIFLGFKEPDYKRTVNCQHCLRVSGKHNDLEEVGFDSYHHTMFEMLGNWSFDDYSKEDAIMYAWELLTEIFKIEKGRLYVTVFNGDKEDNIGQDDESFEIWKKIVPEENIIFCSKKDNFWEMSSIGPCGPCTEIHIDLRSEEERIKLSAIDLINKDHPLVIELWNIVFIEYIRKKDLSLVSLGKKFVDTGMGFERLAMVLQNKKSTYEIDTFSVIIKSICHITSVKYGDSDKKDIAVRIIADHVRSVCFSIADGQIPENTGAGYVIRRILRRAIRYAFSYLGMEKPFIFMLVKDIIKSMPDYHQIKENQDFIENIIQNEENLFLKTLNKGLILIDEIISNTNSKVIEGKSIFDLYDTYGFPVDLTAIILKERGFSFKQKEFDECLVLQKERSKKNQKNVVSEWVAVFDDDIQEFIGYEKTSCVARLVKYREVKFENEKQYHLVFNYTPFYAEAGGQVGDKGFLDSNNDKIDIINTFLDLGIAIHVVKQLPDNLNVDFNLFVNQEKRIKTSINHSATHLLHFALRSFLGNHIEQRGSYVCDDYLRFDFSHFKKIELKDLNKLEFLVNSLITQNISLETEVIPFNEAKKNGAVALFGEKYGDLVRVVKFGDSIELCGGTHVNSTGEIGLFKIISESSSSSGIRRIEAITNNKALSYFQKLELDFSVIKDMVKNKNIVEGVRVLFDEKKSLNEKLDFHKKQEILNLNKDFLAKVKDGEKYKSIIELTDLSPDILKSLCLSLFKKNNNIFVFLASSFNGKKYFTMGFSKDLISRNKIDIDNIVSKINDNFDSKGGGSRDFYFYTLSQEIDIKELIEFVSGSII